MIINIKIAIIINMIINIIIIILLLLLMIIIIVTVIIIIMIIIIAIGKIGNVDNTKVMNMVTYSNSYTFSSKCN